LSLAEAKAHAERPPPHFARENVPEEDEEDEEGFQC
jgi:hypothetical protein